MAKKAIETTEKPVEATQKKAEPRSKNASGFYMYLGPNLKGLIQFGTVFRGTWEEALEKAAPAIAAHPLVKTLIVSGDALPSARLKVKTPGNVLYANYQKLAGKEGK